MEVFAIIPYVNGAILTSLSKFLVLAANRGGISERDVNYKIADLENRIQEKIDDLAENRRKLSAMEKNDIRTEFTKVCRTLRFDADQKYAMESIRSRLSKELGCVIPSSVIVVERKWLQSRLL